MSKPISIKKISRPAVLLVVLIFLLTIALNLKYSTKTKHSHNIDYNDLEQTTFVVTLDSNLPIHKNVIWCSTFQMTWDKLKNDLIGEPVELIEAQDLADMLNQSEFPPKNLDESSYYTAAGFVKDGIIEKIQADMAQRFPDEPTPVFSIGYYSFPEPIVVYAYLNMNIEFRYPFYTYEEPFSFKSSNKEKTNVAAFSSETEIKDGNYNKIHAQVNVLYYEHGGDEYSDYFAVDLCKHTHPYQVILAIVPQKNSFEDMILDVENNISQYKNDFRAWPEFMPTDKLIVPDVLYKITHVYNEFIMKNINNEPWKTDGYFIFDAQQTIDFSLTRSGVVLKSEGTLGAAGGGSNPRYLYFNRPFLIYAKKRDSNSKPFFAMWIDNVELLKKYEK